MFQRVRIAGRVLPREFEEDPAPRLDFFLVCQQALLDHQLCLLVLKQPRSASLESPLSLLKSGSPYLNRHHRRCLTVRPSPIQEPQRQ